MVLATSDEDRGRNRLQKLAEAGERLRAYCDEKKLEVEEGLNIRGAKCFKVKMANGRLKRPITLSSVSEIDSLIASDFGRYVFLGRMQAICSYEDGYLEAGIRSHNAFGMNRLENLLDNHLEYPTDRRLRYGINASSTEISGKPIISLSPASDTFEMMAYSVRTISKHVTFKVRGVEVKNHDQALDLLERIAKATFFDIDMSTGCALGLIVIRQDLRREDRADEGQSPLQIEFPRHEYNHDALSLYNYGRAAEGMPLLEYLAYYQTIEYHYHTYSEIEAFKRIRRIIKQPDFRSDNDMHIGKILSVLKGGPSRSADERTQLRSTIRECLDATSLRKYLTENKGRSDFFMKATNGLTDKKLSIGTKDFDLRDEVADRIYDIRCKIVHTKSGYGEGEYRPLLPFSPEADLLSHDIELVRYIAREVLMTASTPFALK